MSVWAELAKSGPLALVLGVALVVLWREYKATLKKHEELYEKVLRIVRGLNGGEDEA